MQEHSSGFSVLKTVLYLAPVIRGMRLLIIVMGIFCKIWFWQALKFIIYLQETKEAPKVELKDLKSKYGTFLNNDIQKNKQLSPNVPHELHHGDRVRFGVLKNTWRLVFKAALRKGWKLQQFYNYEKGFCKPVVRDWLVEDKSCMSEDYIIYWIIQFFNPEKV